MHSHSAIRGPVPARVAFRLWRCLLLSAVVYPVVWAQTAPKPATTVKTDTRFEKIEASVQRVPTKARQLFPAEILTSALLADQVDDQASVELWRKRLWDDGTAADKAFRLFRALLQGEPTDPFDLYDALPNAKWYSLALLPIKTVSRVPVPDSHRDAATSMHLLALCSASTPLSLAKPSIRALIEASEPVRMDLVRALRAASGRRQHAGALTRFRTHLRYALRAGKLIDKEWCTVLCELTTASYEAQDILRSLRESKDVVRAADIAIQMANRHPADGHVMVAALGLLLRQDDGEKALAFALDAETRAPYPARREVRLHYLRTLRYDGHRSDNKRHLPSGMLTYWQERNEREYAATWTDDIEAQMAIGDVYYLERRYGEALAAYKDVCLRSTDAAMRWTAWMAWADLNPHSAWYHRKLVEDVPAAAGDSGVNPDAYLGFCVGVAIAAEDIDSALEWVSNRYNEKQEAGDGRTLRAVLSALAWASGNESYALTLLQTADDTAKNATLTTILALTDDAIARVASLPPGVARTVTLTLKKTLDPLRCWIRGSEFLVHVLPSYASAGNLSAAWQSVTRAYPDDSDAQAKHHQEAVSAACLQWMDAHPDDEAGLITLLQAAAHQIKQHQDCTAARLTAPVFFGCLERASARNTPLLRVTSAVSDYLDGLTATKVDAPTVAQAKATITRLYPDSNQAP